MLISVIIPTYNRADTIERAVDSVLAQTWPDIETIVVDDGSKDQTLKVLEKYGDKIRVIAQKNQGPSAARNNGIRAARGEVISFLDSDDSWLPEKTERQAKLLQRTASAGVGCCVSNTRMIYTDRAPTTSFQLADLNPKLDEGIWRNPTEILLTRFLLFNQAAAIRREVLEEAGYFREDLRILEDYDLALRLSMTCAWGFTTDPLVMWNGGAANSLTANSTDLAACQRSCDVLNSLKNSPRWGKRLPQSLLDERLIYLERKVRAYRLTVSSNKFTTLMGRSFLRVLKYYKAIHDRLPSFPRIIAEQA